jgi:hypothetical protein
VKRERFPHASLFLETFIEGDRRVFVCSTKSTSVFRCSTREVLAFYKWPAKTPTGDALRAWLQDLERRDAAKAPQARQEGLSDEIKATGWGPEANGLDESDPQFQTRTVI